MKLAKYISLHEVTCRCGCTMPRTAELNMIVTAYMVSVIREHIGEPIYVTSGYRCPSHNARVGGASRSYHMYGMAMDIWCSGITPLTLRDTIAQLIADGKILAGGLKAYDSFVHYDIRGTFVNF